MEKPVFEPFVFEEKVKRDSQEAVSHKMKDECVIADEEYFTADDGECSEKMQLSEALFASIFSSRIVDNASSSVEEPSIGTEPLKIDNEVENPSQIFCGICLENKRSWQMFRNDKCPHTFCYDCTTNHIIAKIQDGVKTVSCPALNCKAMLNFDTCRLLIPADALVRWDETLCLSLIPESSKLYCPFRDCSAMLVNDSGAIIREVNCVSCKRSFCAECRVPWHSDFTCKEFQKLYAKKGGKGDKIMKLLAKKKLWQKCPKCKMLVEKTEGCIHIICRCRYEFCYRCGSKWNDSHGNCKQK